MRMPIKRGRGFTESDTDGTPRVAIVDERLAKRFWGGADPIGRRMYRPQRPEEVAKPGPDSLWLQVVGVVGTVKLKGLIEGEDARIGAYYYPYAQDAQRGVAFAIRTTGRPGGRDRRSPARTGRSGSGGAALRRAQHA